MSVYNLPVVGSNASPTNNTEIVAWQFLRQLWLGVAERAWLTETGGCIWPRSSHTWESGRVPANVTETSFTDNSKTWCGGTDDVSGNTYANPWGCALYSTSAGARTDYFPTIWFLVIDDYDPLSGGGNDPAKVVITQITSWKNTGELHYNTICDYFVSGQLGTQSGTGAADVSGLAGKFYRIIGYSWAVDWSQRVLEFPNDVEYAAGTVSVSTHSNLTDLSALMNPGALARKDLLVRGDDGRLKRVTLTTNGSNGLTFPVASWFPATNAAYSVVSHGNRAVPGRAPTYPYTFYRGIKEGFYSHNPDDTPGGVVQMPAKTKRLQKPDGFGACIDDDRPAWDADVWTDFPLSDDELACLVADRNYSPDLFKTLHGLQLALEALSTSFVENKSYDGTGFIPFLNPALMFKLAGAAQVAAGATPSLQVFTSTTGNVEGVGPAFANNAIALSAGFGFPADQTYPLQVWYNIFSLPNTAGGFGPGNNHWGKGILTSPTRLLQESGDPFPFTQSDPTGPPVVVGDNGRTCTIAFGFSQFEPLEFARLFDEPGTLIPDTKDDGFGNRIAVDPPTLYNYTNTGCVGGGLGTWTARGHSTVYLSRKEESQDFTTPRASPGRTATVSDQRTSSTSPASPAPGSSIRLRPTASRRPAPGPSSRPLVTPPHRTGSGSTSANWSRGTSRPATRS
jgi:hypothetical protein